MKFFKLTHIVLLTFTVLLPALHAATLEITPDTIAAELSKEFKCGYCLDASSDGTLKFKTERRGRPIVWVSNPEHVLKTSEVATLLQLRFDQYPNKDAIFHIFHLAVRNNSSNAQAYYRLEINGAWATLFANNSTKENIDLIKAWCENFSQLFKLM